LRRAKQAEPECGEEEGHGRLVEQADAGGDAEKRPPEACRAAALDEDDCKQTEAPEHGFAGVHGEETVKADVLWATDEADHRQRLRGSLTAQRPSEDAAEEDHDGPGECGKNADGEKRVAEEDLAEPCLNGDDGALIDVAPGEMMAAGDVVELVAEVAVAEVLRVEREREVEQQLARGEEGCETESCAEGWIGWADYGRRCGCGGHRLVKRVRQLAMAGSHKLSWLDQAS